MQSRHVAAHAGFLIAVILVAAPARAAETDVQRQLQLREQQQMELRLKMQQQLDRSSRPPQTPSANLQQHTFERDQQQRLQQFGDQQLRSTIGPVTPGAAAGTATIDQMRRDLDAQRALGAGGLQPSPLGFQSGPFRAAPPQTLDSGSAP